MIRRFGASERAVSTALGYVLTLSITVILISGLLVASGGFISDERTRVTETELEVVGHRLAAAIEATDRTASMSGDVSVKTTVGLPSRVAGTTYTIKIVPGSPPELILRSANPEVTVRVLLKEDVPVAEGSTGGGDVVIQSDGTSIEVSG